MIWAVTVFVFLTNGHSYNFVIAEYDAENACRSAAAAENHNIVESGDGATIKVECVPTDPDL